MPLAKMDRIVAYSPFRVSFAGGGTDIEPFCSTHGGAVINTAIDRGVTIIYTPDNYDLEISSRDFLKSVLVVSEKDSADVLHKMIGLLREHGIERGRLSISSGVPPGSGLGSSSALTTALLSIINNYSGISSTPSDLASKAFMIEREYFGITLGKQDPFAISFGGFKFMQFSADSEKNFPLKQNSDFWKEIERRTILIYTGKTRESSDYLRDQVKRSSMGDSEINRNLLEMKRITEEMYGAALRNDIATFAHGISAGWEIKKKLGNKVSNSKIDTIISEALSNGAMAAKLMGGGGEGFVLALCEKDSVEKVQKAMMTHSDFVIRVSFDPNGTRSGRYAGIFPK